MKCGNSGEAATWFSECARMRARPAGPAESSVFHNFARRGPTKEAHRRALNRPDGLQRSVAGQGHGRFLPVTLPRGASDQGKRAEAGSHRSPTPGGTHQGRGWGTHQGRDQGTPRGTDPGGCQGDREISVQRARRRLGIARGNSATGRAGGLNRPRRGRDPAPGRVRPMPSPGGNTTRPEGARRQARSSSPPAPASWDGQAADWRLRGLQLDPGSGRMVPVTRVGRSALRAAAPAGRGRYRSGAGGPDSSPGIVARPELTAAGNCRPRWRPKPGALGTERHSLWRPHRS